jgi:hypothetical protein
VKTNTHTPEKGENEKFFKIKIFAMTYIYSKKDFIEFIQTQVKDDEVIVFSNSVTGNLSISKKVGIKITHQYAHTAFKDVGIGHIAFGETQPIGVLIVKEKRISEDGKKAMANILKS